MYALCKFSVAFRGSFRLLKISSKLNSKINQKKFTHVVEQPLGFVSFSKHMVRLRKLVYSKVQTRSCVFKV